MISPKERNVFTSCSLKASAFLRLKSCPPDRAVNDGGTVWFIWDDLNEAQALAVLNERDFGLCVGYYRCVREIKRALNSALHDPSGRRLRGER